MECRQCAVPGLRFGECCQADQAPENGQAPQEDSPRLQHKRSLTNGAAAAELSPTKRQRLESSADVPSASPKTAGKSASPCTSAELQAQQFEADNVFQGMDLCTSHQIPDSALRSVTSAMSIS